MRAKSLVLKDTMGKPAGYVIAEGEDVSFCARLKHGEECTLTVILEDGSSRACIVSSPGSCVVSCGSMCIACAYVSCGDLLLLYSDEAAKAAFLSARARKPVLSDADSHQTGNGEDHAGTPAAPTGCSDSGTCTNNTKEGRLYHMQPRWPAPPCLVCPGYRDGVWQDEG